MLFIKAAEDNNAYKSNDIKIFRFLYFLCTKLK